MFCQGFHSAQRLQQVLGNMRKQAQLAACKDAAVLAMTSTFAALNRDLLQRIGPRIVIVEEAGELLECQLMACLPSPNLEQVILIGDHQQLRPKLNTHELCCKKHFDVSLFERLVRQGCVGAQLTTQLRMQPDVCDLMRVFYARIENHERVMRYPATIAGVADTLQWVSHSAAEERSGLSSVGSKSNIYEAKFACRLAKHLVLNGIAKDRITLLTPYIGQSRELKKHLEQELRSCRVEQNGGVVPGVRIVTIDDYQGEENDVIILSLVRSNAERKLGFCSIENRIIVALSRARYGMYILGDAEMFRQDDNWYKVLSKLEARGRVAQGMNLCCAKHPTDKSIVFAAEDFDTKAKHGGCHRKCNSLLPRCGHRCVLHCHPFDQEHKDIACLQMCSRSRPAGCSHKCPNVCRDCLGEAADEVCSSPCQVPVAVSLPCGHMQSEPCHRVHDQAQLLGIECRTDVTVRLACGHSCSTSCAMASGGLEELACSHSEELEAPCGHRVLRLCKTLQACSQPCRELLPCAHKCQEPCGEGHTVLCASPCPRVCAHGWQCPKKCYERCVPCQEPCGWRCKHLRCGRRCHEPCDREPCQESCDRTLDCGHGCRGLCGEPCPRCVCCHQADEHCPLTLERLVDLPRVYQLDCGHSFDVGMLDQWMAGDQGGGDHVAILAKCCPTCRQPLHTSPRYGIHVKKQLALIDKVKDAVAQRHGRERQALSEVERREVDRAMGGGQSAGGRWFACPNGHPYYIGDCGGAMVESTCPECGARVGGSAHRLREDNQYLANFAGDGPVRPAWPGMG